MPADLAEQVDRFEDVNRVVADPLRFKLRLGIGEDAYASLKLKKAVQELWDVGGAAATGAGVAASPIVATTFFGSSAGLLSFIGIGAAVTPVGWVVAAGVTCAAGYYGVTRLFHSYSSSRVETIPRFINTPIDVLGASLLDMMGSLAVALARIDDRFTPDEGAVISEYFTTEWGFDALYVDRALSLIGDNTNKLGVQDCARILARFQADHPDCNARAMTDQIVAFLSEIAEADGVLDEREDLAIDRVQQILREETRLSLAKAKRKVGSLGATALGVLKQVRPRLRQG